MRAGKVHTGSCGGHSRPSLAMGSAPFCVIHHLSHLLASLSGAWETPAAVTLDRAAHTPAARGEVQVDHADEVPIQTIKHLCW